MSEPTSEDGMMFMMISFGLVDSIPKPQTWRDIPDWHYMTPGLKTLTLKYYSEVGLEAKDGRVFNPRLTRMQKIGRFIRGLFRHK